MQIMLRAIGVITALVLLVISAGINARFGFELGRTPLDGTIYAAASVASDGFKVASVFFTMLGLCCQTAAFGGCKPCAVCLVHGLFAGERGGFCSGQSQ